MNQPKIIITKDGSSTLYSDEYKQHYHNPNGAVGESRHIFFQQSGLANALQTKSSLHIFETGLGTGLNLAILNSLLETENVAADVHFFSVEASPLTTTQAGKIAFGNNPELEPSRDMLTDIFSSLTPGINEFPFSNRLSVTIFYGLFHDLFENHLFQNSFDFIFHDAFSPQVNAELWTPDTFSNLASIAKPDAVLTTYCAASSARAAMAVAGWKLCKKKGALGKREMTIASLSEKKLKNCKRLNEKRLAERYLRNEFSLE